MKQTVVKVGDAKAACALRRKRAGRSRRTSSRSGSSARRAGLEEARLVNLARQSSVSLSCGKRFLSWSGFCVAAGRRRGDGEVVDRCRCACPWATIPPHISHIKRDARQRGIFFGHHMQTTQGMCFDRFHWDVVPQRSPSP